MTDYDLSHLVQESMEVIGPIQDDEALLLYAICRVMGARNVIEFGFGEGYSARNFLAAGCRVFSVDHKPFVPINESHVALVMDCSRITSADVGGAAFDLVFFDCHDEEGQLTALHALDSTLAEDVILAFHDTGKHDEKLCRWSTIDTDGRWIHCGPERRMVLRLQPQGWETICFHPPKGRFKWRHGLTLMKRWRGL